MAPVEMLRQRISLGALLAEVPVGQLMKSGENPHRYDIKLKSSAQHVLRRHALIRLHWYADFFGLSLVTVPSRLFCCWNKPLLSLRGSIAVQGPIFVCKDSVAEWERQDNDS